MNAASQHFIIFSSIPWSFLNQAPQEIARLMGCEGRVLFIEPLGSRRVRLHDFFKIPFFFKKKTALPPNIDVYHWPVLSFLAAWNPFVCRLLSYFLKKRISRFLENSQNAIFLFFSPHPVFIKVAGQFPAKRRIYYCLADFEALFPTQTQLLKNQKGLIHQVDLLFLQNKKVLRITDEIVERKTYIFRPGYSEWTTTPKLPLKRGTETPPCVLYIGGLHQHIDFELLDETVQTLKKVIFVFVGPLLCFGARRFIRKHPNVKHIPMLPYDHLRHLAADCRAAIIPYRIDKFTESVFPVKLFDYLRFGCGVISSHLPEVVDFAKERQIKTIYFAERGQEFAEAIELALIDGVKTNTTRRGLQMDDLWTEKYKKMKTLWNAPSRTNHA